jgi:TonB family protein
LFTVAEELVRTAFWFHPAVWWVLGQIQLAREQSVDRQVIDGTCSREEYVDALLAIARGRFRLDLAPASLFLRKRHLKQRLVSILKEVRMSKTRLFSLLALDLGVLAAACWLITAAFPLRAAPQEVVDAPGVTLEIPGPTLMHRAPVAYPEAARQQGIQGTVTVQVRIDSDGSVADAQVLSGPDPLRKPVLQSVLNWHFAKEAAGTTRHVSIVFQLPAGAAPVPTAQTPPPPVRTGQVSQVLKSITVVGLSDQARTDLLSRLPVREGDLFGPAQSVQVIRVLKDFDDHLALTLTPVAGGGSGLTIGPSELLQLAFPPPPSADSQPGPQRIRVGGNMQALKLVSQAKTVYPPLAKQSRVEGIVSLNAVIGKDGTMQNLTVISGHPLLVPAALESVQQWTYQPTLLNGAPIEVVTQIDVNFTLAR